MQGYVSEIEMKSEHFQYYYLNICRRSKHMSGTRFKSRGIDKKGRTANSV